ncbi:hypothetical protein [Sphingomonas sp. PWP1-2]|uniref:hypothetical protein n=1 Tax=Sphingomonas sp. PWP1-2 TaxID=2804558 RepID=UPI003CF3DB6B
MRFLFALLLASPALAAPHSGVVKVRTGPELSDIVLFVVAALGIWLIRRAMRARFAKRDTPKD